MRIAIWLVAVAWPGSLLADGGMPCWSGSVGPYRVAVFISPNPLRVGLGDCSLIVQDAATHELVPQAQATLRLVPRDMSRPPRSVEFGQSGSERRLFQSAELHLPEAGWWEFELSIDGSEEPATASFALEVADAPPRWLTFWPWFSWPAVAIALFGIHQWLVSRAAAKRT